MGRRRTQLKLTAQQHSHITHLLKTTSDARTRERLQFAQRASSGRHTLDDLARLADRSRSTIQNWLVKFESNGLTGLLARDTAPGKESPLAEAKIQDQLQKGMESGRWKTAVEVALWLKKEHGVERSRKSIYYWLRKRNVRSRKPNG